VRPGAAGQGTARQGLFEHEERTMKQLWFWINEVATLILLAGLIAFMVMLGVAQ